MDPLFNRINLSSINKLSTFINEALPRKEAVPITTKSPFKVVVLVTVKLFKVEAPAVDKVPPTAKLFWILALPEIEAPPEAYNKPFCLFTLKAVVAASLLL